MTEVVDLVSAALRRKLLRQGARSLSEGEWHLLRVAHLLHSIDDGTLERLLGDSPLAELLALADGLDSIGEPGAARALRAVTTELAAANDPGNGLKRADTVATTGRELERRIGTLRAGIEERLLDYAFRQGEREPAAEPA